MKKKSPALPKHNKQIKEHDLPIDQQNLEPIINLFFEAGMLRHIPRTGYAYLGTGKENVAEHSYRTAIIGYILAKLSGANPERTCLLCLFHDFSETRTADQNYLNHMYVKVHTDKALIDAFQGTGFENDMLELWSEYKECITTESILAHDADQIDLALNLKKEHDLGNNYAQQWLTDLLPRLKSTIAKKCYHILLKTDHTTWWYKQKNMDWWKTRDKKTKD